MHGTVRALVADFTRHGGRIDLARAVFPHVENWTDLSTGIAPWPYPVSLTAAAAEQLPDPGDLAKLEAAAAVSFGVDPTRVVAVPGSDLAMRLLGLMLRRRSFVFRAAIVRPGYSGHAAMWGAHKPAACALDDIGLMAPAHDVLVLARPNNPDGRAADPLLLEWAALSVAKRGGHVIVDEAFADADPANSLLENDWPGLIVLRSFGKFFGLAGLRLGFVVAPQEIGTELRALIGDWPISGPALATGLAAYRDAEWQIAQRARLATASQRLVELLTRHGIPVVGGTAFFTLASVRHRDRLFVHLAQGGVLTRPFDYEPCWLRIGLPRDERDWARLDEALSSWSMT